MVAASGAKAKTTTRSVDVPIQQVFENCKNFSRNSEKAKAINDKVMEFIALDDQPFSVIDNLGFCKMLFTDKPVSSVKRVLLNNSRGMHFLLKLCNDLICLCI